MATTPDLLDDSLLPYEPFRRLNTDLRRAAETMPDNEVRYLIDTYYALQEARKAGDNRLRASTADHEPNSLTAFLAAQVEALEGACNSSLQIIARRTRAGRWCMAIKGISGVLTAGLLASLDVRRAPSAASFWRFAGLDPSWTWLGKDRALPPAGTPPPRAIGNADRGDENALVPSTGAQLMRYTTKTGPWWSWYPHRRGVTHAALYPTTTPTAADPLPLSQLWAGRRVVV